MALSSKDALTTVLAAGTAAVLYIQAKGVDVAVLSSPRWAAAIVAILGIAMCAGGSSTDAAKSAWTTPMGIAGGLVLLAALVGLITGNKVWAEVGAVIVLLMWVVSTGRHAVAE